MPKYAEEILAAVNALIFWKNTIVVRLLPKVVIMILRKVLSL